MREGNSTENKIKCIFNSSIIIPTPLNNLNTTNNTNLNIKDTNPNNKDTNLNNINNSNKDMVKIIYILGYPP